MDNGSGRLSRRAVVGGVGAGVATAAATAGMGRVPQSSGETGGTAPPLTDPREKYPKPPFERQSQPWPGLASSMVPVPDHGERSSRGSGR